MGKAPVNVKHGQAGGKACHFRPLCVEDIPALVEIEKRSFTTPWTKEAFLQELRDNAFAHYTVVEMGERVVAYCGIWLIGDEAHVTNIAVHPGFRGMRIGEALLVYVMGLSKFKGAKRMTLEVRPSNKVALNLYRKYGFVHEGTRHAYYQDNKEDAWIMWVTL